MIKEPPHKNLNLQPSTLTPQTCLNSVDSNSLAYGKFLGTIKFLVLILDLKYSNIAARFAPCKIFLFKPMNTLS
jgi:hypothetical protein